MTVKYYLSVFNFSSVAGQLLYTNCFQRCRAAAVAHGNPGSALAWKAGALAVPARFAFSVLTAWFRVCRCIQTNQPTTNGLSASARGSPLSLTPPPRSLPFQQATLSSKPPRSKPSSSRPTASRGPRPRPPPSPGSRSSCRRSSPRSTRGAATPRSPTPRRPPSPLPTAAPPAPRRRRAPTSLGPASPPRPAAPWPPRPAGPTPTPAAGLPSAPRATPSLDLATGKEGAPAPTRTRRRATGTPTIPSQRPPGFLIEVPEP